MERKRLKGNFTQIPNDLLEALMKARLTGTELVIVLTTLRDTFGWGKEVKPISNGYFTIQTGLDRSYCIRLIAELKRKNILIKLSGGVRNTIHLYRINPNWAEWSVSFRDGDRQVTNDTQDTISSDSEVTKISDGQVTQEINKEKKERVELIKERIRETLGNTRKAGEDE